jgi:16S rRNA (guanine(966)-N(2))-methyltransferase RsmD
VRPTTDFAKTALFNMLANRFDLEELHVLDLFSGTGSITYEFVSRGVKKITAVDDNANCVKFIISTLEKLHADNARVFKSDAFKFIATSKAKYDLIFADPPYDLADGPKVPAMVFEHGLLADNGWFVFEHSASIDYSASPYFVEMRHYGKVGFSIFQNLVVAEEVL